MGVIRDLSLRQKLTLISVVPAMAGLLIFLGASMLHDRQVYRTFLTNELTSAAHMMAFNSAALLEFEDKLEGVKLLEAASIYNDVDYACIFDRNNELFSEFSRRTPVRSLAPPYPLPEGAYFNSVGVAVYYPVRFGGEQMGTIYIHSTLTSYNGLLQRKALTIAILLLVSSTLTVIIALRFQRLIYNPIIQLAGAAQTISQTNDYSLRVVRQSNDELGDLVEQFNRMLNRVQEKNNALKYEIVVRQAAEQQIAAANEELHYEISQRTQAEEQLGVLLEDLEKKNLELQDFAYVVSHDLRAPLRGINSLATWLTKDYGALLDEKGLRYLDQLRERSRRMHMLIEGILLYSRLGRASISPELLDSHALVRQVIELLSPPDNIRVSIEGHLPMVYYDRIMLLQIFQNLIGNAIQHMGNTTGHVSIGCSASDAEWEFVVRDDGIGIESRHFDRVFKIFQSLNTERNNENNGIGLALVKKIVERNHGRIYLESEPGKGSEFYFTIPLRGEDQQNLGALSIAIVDSNGDYAAVTRKLLENSGHQVYVARSWESAEALFAATGEHLDVVLWDPKNIDVSPSDMVSTIQRFQPQARIIICTVKSSRSGITPDDLPGILGGIYKPLTVEKLNAVLSAGTIKPGAPED